MGQAKSLAKLDFILLQGCVSFFRTIRDSCKTSRCWKSGSWLPTQVYLAAPLPFAADSVRTCFPKILATRFKGAKMKSRSQVHWLGPTTVFLALAAGVLFAAGHHIFYNRLNGTPAPNDAFDVLGSKVSKQELNVACGTAFAFLVRAALVTALSTAYTQLFWRTMIHSSHGATLDSLDTTFSALSSVLSLLKVKVWWRHQLLFLLATLSWCASTA